MGLAQGTVRTLHSSLQTSLSQRREKRPKNGAPGTRRKVQIVLRGSSIIRSSPYLPTYAPKLRYALASRVLGEAAISPKLPAKSSPLLPHSTQPWPLRILCSPGA
eukprot:96052-Rhodomonas_salina.3